VEELGVARDAASKIVAAYSRRGAHFRGVELFRGFRRFVLTMQMRAADDPIHTEYILDMRDTTSESPISAEWVRSLLP